MKKVILLLLAVMVVCACEKAAEKIEAKAQSIPKPTAEDIAADERKADMKVPSLMPKTKGIRTVDVDAAKQTLKDHPLIGLLKPENQRIIQYLKLHTIDYDCRSERQDLVASCDRLVADAVQKCKAAGITVLQEDIKNPDFVDLTMASMQSWKESGSKKQGKEFFEFEALCKTQLEKFKGGEFQL